MQRFYLGPRLMIAFALCNQFKKLSIQKLFYCKIWSHATIHFFVFVIYNKKFNVECCMLQGG